jgi:hypothetical protein
MDAFDHGDYEEAELLSRRAVVLSPFSSNLHYVHASMLVALLHFEEAAFELRASLQIDLGTLEYRKCRPGRVVICYAWAAR